MSYQTKVSKKVKSVTLKKVKSVTLDTRLIQHRNS